MWNYQKNILVCMIAGLGLSTCTPSDVSIPGGATIDVMNGFPMENPDMLWEYPVAMPES